MKSKLLVNILLKKITSEYDIAADKGHVVIYVIFERWLFNVMDIRLSLHKENRVKLKGGRAVCGKFNTGHLFIRFQ